MDDKECLIWRRASGTTRSSMYSTSPRRRIAQKKVETYYYQKKIPLSGGRLFLKENTAAENQRIAIFNIPLTHKTGIIFA